MSPEQDNFTETFGNRLIENKKLDRAAFRRAQLLSQEHNERFQQIITKLGLVSDNDLADELSAHLDCRRIHRDDFPTDPLYKGMISARFLQAHHIVPIAEDVGEIELAMVDPLDDFAADAVRMIAKKDVKRAVATPTDIENAIVALYQDADAGETDANDVGDVIVEEDIERLKDLASEAPVIRAVNLLVIKAVELRASDIHIEPTKTNVRVRYRVDGQLQEAEPFPLTLKAAIISRIKIMAQLDIAERRLPQDGRHNMPVRGALVDLRISTMPTINGESIVIRVLDRSNIELNFDALGFEGPGFELFLTDLDQPNGIILVVGPTGSGKTTTLYTALLHLNQASRHLISVEDPVEYEISGVNQVQVKADIDLDFASVLRSILRHDPDVIMVGEIRDRETADISVRAALTGHLVLSTLHTNDAAGSIARLMDMEIESFLLTASLRGILAQRLVRRLCDACKEPNDLSQEVIASLRMDDILAVEDRQFYTAKGCPQCQDTGYRGRICVYEYLHVSAEVRKSILQKAETDEISRIAISEGMRTAYADGLQKALNGLTTVEEVLRVTHKG